MRINQKFLVILSFLAFFNFYNFLEAQEPLSTSKIWYANILRAWFPEKIEFLGSPQYITRIRCSNKDITHFNAKAGKNNIGLGSAFQIEGSLIIDALPPNLKVIDGAKGKKYMLQLQGYLFSKQGKLIWSQKGYPIGDSWISNNGSTIKFRLIDNYSGLLKGCTAVVLAIGDPILIEGTSETKVILGMKRYSFKDENESSTYFPTSSNLTQTTKKIQNSTKKNQKYNNIKYVQKKYNIFTYTEAVTIPIQERKKIFYELVDYQDRTGNDEGAFMIIAKRFGIPKKAVTSISGEGAVKNWPMP